MALSQNTYVHMETMETTKDEKEKSYQNGNTRILCAYGGKQPKRTLVLFKPYNSKTSDVKRKTDKREGVKISVSMEIDLL